VGSKITGNWLAMHKQCNYNITQDPQPNQYTAMAISVSGPQYNRKPVGRVEEGSW
jgi:hypothetical protein